MVQPTEDDADPGDDGSETAVRALVQTYLRSKAIGHDEESAAIRRAPVVTGTG